jgi:hypothetical protein
MKEVKTLKFELELRNPKFNKTMNKINITKSSCAFSPVGPKYVTSPPRFKSNN